MLELIIELIGLNATHCRVRENGGMWAVAVLIIYAAGGEGRWKDGACHLPDVLDVHGVLAFLKEGGRFYSPSRRTDIESLSFAAATVPAVERRGFGQVLCDEPNLFELCSEGEREGARSVRFRPLRAVVDTTAV